MIPGYPKSANLMLLNTMYIKARRQEDGKYSKDKMVLTIKDLDAKTKFQYTIEEPEYEFYIAKDDVEITHNLLFIEEEKVNKVKVKFRDLLKEIAVLSDNTEFFYDNIKSKNFYANNVLFTYNRIFNADMDIEDNFRLRFYKYYGMNIDLPEMAFFDIEADTIDMVGDFPEPGECPVNAITYIDNNTKQVYTLLLHNDSNPQIKKLEQEIKTPEGYKKFIEDINTNLLKSCQNNTKQFRRLELDKLEYSIKFYDEEIDLLVEFFNIVNGLKPDILLAWNMAFDLPYLIERLRTIGYDPREIIPHPDYDTNEAYYYIDERMANIPEEKGDFAKISSYTVFMDQLIHFASRRKGQSKLKSMKLDYIGYVTAKLQKLDYSHITRDIAQLPYKDYRIFAIYNIIDTVVQMAIEFKTGDINYIFNKAQLNITRYHKAHRQTIYIPNRMILEFSDNGLIAGNNVNKFKSRPTEKFPGALVGNPLNIEQDNLVKTPLNTFIRIAENVIDFDFKALYPSIMEENNIAPNSEIGKITIKDKPFKEVNPFGNTRFNDGGLFLEDYSSDNIIEFTRRWFQLPDVLEMINSIDKYFDENEPLYDHKGYDPITGLVRPFRVRTSELFKPFSIDDFIHKPFSIQESMPK